MVVITEKRAVPCSNKNVAGDCNSTCNVKLYQHWGNRGNAGAIYGYDESGNFMGKFENHATSATTTADESCMAVGYSWWEGERNGREYGDIKMFRNGYRDLKPTPEGVEPSRKGGRKKRKEDHWSDDLDGIRFQTVPSATPSQMQYHIKVPVQTPHNYFSPINIEDDGGKVKDENGTKFNPCPGASAKYFNSKSGVRCIYPKNDKAGADALKTLEGAKGNYKSNESTMYTDLVGKFCADSNNVFQSPGPRTCLDITAGKALAVEYCKKGANIKGANGGDPNCSADLTSLGDSYGTVAKAFCEANPNDSFCSCYNVVNDKCANDSKTGVKGCAATSEYVDLRNATPTEFQNVWDGQRKCGSVCTGANKYIPDNNQAGCKTTIQICAQDINVGSMSESDIKASCELNAETGSSAGAPPPTPPTSSQLSAQEDLEEAKAAVARGDPGAQEKLDAAEAALGAADDAAGETGPRAYIPKSLDGLKNDRKQQIGAGVMGALVLGCMMMLLLIVASASGGGSVKKRLR